MEMDRNILLGGLYYVEDRLQEAQGLLQQLNATEKQYQETKTVLKEGRHVDIDLHILTKPQWLMLFLMSAGAIFTLCVDIYNCIQHQGFRFLHYAVFLVCLGILVHDRYLDTRKKKLAMLFLGYSTICSIRDVYLVFQYGYPFLYIAFLLAGLILAAPVIVTAVHMVNRNVEQRNQRVDERNRERTQREKENNDNVRAANQQVQARCLQLQEQFAAVMQDLLDQTGSWYPPKYYSLGCVGFFIEDVENYRSNTVQEMVLNFEQSQYRQKMLAAQERQNAQLDQIIRGQMELSGELDQLNMLQAMSMIQRSIQTYSIKQTIREESHRIDPYSRY